MSFLSLCLSLLHLKSHRLSCHAAGRKPALSTHQNTGEEGGSVVQASEGRHFGVVFWEWILMEEGWKAWRC